MKSPIVSFLLFGSLSALSQTLLDPLIVSATRSSRSASDTAYSTATIDADFIRETSRRTIPEALQYTPGVLVQKTAHGHGSPIIRGFTGRQNLLLVDGVRLNNSSWRSGPVQYWNTIDSLSIDHLELIKNQGSVLYGSDAIGGTLNAFTKSSDFKNRTEGEIYQAGSATYEFRANGQGSHIGRLETETGIGGKFGIMLGLTAKDFGDIEDSSVGRMHGTGYPEQDLDLRADYAVTADSTLTLYHSQVNQDDVSRWHRTRNNPGWTHGNHVATAGKWTSNTYDQERSLSYLRYSGENADHSAAIQRWNATLSYQTSADSEFQNRNRIPYDPKEDSLRKSHIDLETIGIDLMLESKMGAGNLVYGLDYYRDLIESSGSKNNQAGTKYSELLPIGDDSNYDLLGIYSQYEWQATEPLEITGGLRYTYADASFGRYYDNKGVQQPSASANWDSLVSSLRALYKLNEQWSVYAGASEAFRAPNLNDLTGNIVSNSGSAAAGSTSLEPEEFLTWEIGSHHQTDTTSLDVSLFHTEVDQMITPVPITKPDDSNTLNANAADGYIHGVEVEGAWRFHPQWTLSGFTSWQEGEVEAPSYIDGPIVEKYMKYLLPLTGSIALRWTHPDEKYWVEGRIFGADTEDRTSDADQELDKERIPTNGTPGYLIASIYAGWKVNDHLDLSCGAENLSDEDYRIHGSGQNEPGLTGVFRAKVSW